MDRVNQYGALDEEWQRQGLDRRRFLRLVAMGASASTLATIIAACRQAPTGATTSAAAPTQPAAAAAPTFVAQTVGTPAVVTAPTAQPLIHRAFFVPLNRAP